MEKKTIFFLSGISLLILFFVVGIGVYLEAGWIQGIDQIGNLYLRQGIPDSYLNFFLEVTNFGENPTVIRFLLILVFLLFMFKKGMAGLWTLATVLICGMGTPMLLKLLFVRPRPPYALMHVGGYSFPSGHSTISAVFYGMLIILALLYLQKEWLKCLIIFAMTLMILLVMWSRVFLGVHYLSDTLGGLLLGSAQILISLSLFLKLKYKK